MASTPILPGDSADASSGRCTLRSYGEPIDVQQGLVAGCEAPEQFLWRDRLWVVRRVLAHWVETGAWWEQAGVSALLGISSSAALSPGATAELLEEREVWRVEAARSRHSSGVFDLAFSWGGEPWRLLCSID
jgi:hypothetical protein